MDKFKDCEHCGGDIPVYAYHGLCPHCYHELRRPVTPPPKPPPARPSEKGVAYNYIGHLLKQQRNMLGRFSLNSEQEILEEIETIRICEEWISKK